MNSLEERFEIWMQQADLPNENINNSNNKKMLEYFKNYIEGLSIYEVKLDDYVGMLKFSLENKIHLYFIQDQKTIIGLVCFDKYNGGRIGLVHGGCLFYTLFLCVTILMDKAYPLKDRKYYEKYTENITTNYKNLVPINTIHMIRVAMENEDIIGEILNHQQKICVKIHLKFIKPKL